MVQIIFFSPMKIERSEYALQLSKPDLGALHLPKLHPGNGKNRIMSFHIRMT
jgi:hypothetical protein